MHQLGLTDLTGDSLAQPPTTPTRASTHPRPIVCATTEVKLVWTLILGRIAPAVLAHVPASMCGAMAGRSPHEAIFLQDTALDMNPYEMMVTSVDVQGAFGRFWAH